MMDEHALPTREERAIDAAIRAVRRTPEAQAWRAWNAWADNWEFRRDWSAEAGRRTLEEVQEGLERAHLPLGREYRQALLAARASLEAALLKIGANPDAPNVKIGSEEWARGTVGLAKMAKSRASRAREVFDASG